MRDPQWCLKQAQDVGDYCHALIERLFANGIVERLRAAQGVIRLRKPYGDSRLNAACRRALAFENIGYGSVKTICERCVAYEYAVASAFLYTRNKSCCFSSSEMTSP